MLTPKQAKTISIIEFMRARGFEPARMHGRQVFYQSPFREETEPSFNVREGGGNEGEDIWHDFGLGGNGGGDIIELVKRIDNVGFREALTTLERYYKGAALSSVQNITPKVEPTLFSGSETRSIKLKAVRPLNHFVLLKYLQEERCISKAIAQKYLRLIWYDNGGAKDHFAFGWENQSGAYELRGAGKTVFKAVTGKKDITPFLSSFNTSSQCFVFEGMLDFLSTLELKGTNHLPGDVIILNSSSLISRLLAFLKGKSYQTIFTLFDNDGAGEKALQSFREKSGHPDIRQQTFYAGFNDVNDYLVSKRQKS